MTEMERCEWCRRVLPARQGRGRPRKFCSQRCRQWHWVSSQRAHELELSEDELVIAKTTLDMLHDDLYVLACAVDDADRDLKDLDDPAADDLKGIINWLLDAARPLRDRELSPPRSDPRERLTVPIR